MYVPASFRESNPTRLFDFIDQHSFATLISQVGNELIATHLPLLLDRETGQHGVLLGHMARANPQWKSLHRQQVLSIFHGPHSYISPTWMGGGDNVPTWNYVAVHAYGEFELIDDASRLRQLLVKMVQHYESHQPLPWSVEAASDQYLDKLQAAIVGFSIRIVRLEGKWKLSQNHPLNRRSQIISGLRRSGSDSDLQVADLMSELDAQALPNDPLPDR